MAVFVVRRLAVSFVTLLVATFVVYVLVANAGDPLADLRTDPSAEPGRQDPRPDRGPEPRPVRARSGTSSGSGAPPAASLPGSGCDLGKNIRGQDVTALVSLRPLGSTLRLVVVATILAILVGISLGVDLGAAPVLGARLLDDVLRLPLLLAAGLRVRRAAQAVRRDPASTTGSEIRRSSVPTALALAVRQRRVLGSPLGGDRRRRWIVRGVAAVLTFGLLMYLSAVEWFRRPSLGPGAHHRPGVRHRPRRDAARRRAQAAAAVLYSALTMAGDRHRSASSRHPVPRGHAPGPPGRTLLLLAARHDRGRHRRRLRPRRAGQGPGDPGGRRSPDCSTGGVIVVDILLRTLPSYSRLVRGRIFATVGSNTPNFAGDFWQTILDNAFAPRPADDRASC